MGDIRKRHSPADKFKVAMAAHIGDKTVAEISSRFSVHPVQVSQWKKQLKDLALDGFGSRKIKSEVDSALVSQLYEEIGRLKFELDWLKKKAAKFD